MTSISQVANPPVMQEACCQETSRSDQLNRIDVICRIALGIFAAVIAPLYFAVSFGVGTALGAGYAIVRYLQKKNVLDPGEGKPICAQGYMNFLSGMRYPPVINTLATASFIAAHMRHDPHFYVPFSGLFIGLWIGRDAVATTFNLTSRAFSYFRPAPPPPPAPVRKCCCAV